MWLPLLPSDRVHMTSSSDDNETESLSLHSLSLQCGRSTLDIEYRERDETRYRRALSPGFVENERRQIYARTLDAGSRRRVYYIDDLVGNSEEDEYEEKHSCLQQHRLVCVLLFIYNVSETGRLAVSKCSGRWYLFSRSTEYSYRKRGRERERCSVTAAYDRYGNARVAFEWQTILF